MILPQSRLLRFDHLFGTANLSNPIGATTTLNGVGGSNSPCPIMLQPAPTLGWIWGRAAVFPIPTWGLHCIENEFHQKQMENVQFSLQRNSIISAVIQSSLRHVWQVFAPFSDVKALNLAFILTFL